MGAGIAETFAMAGSDVIVIERNALEVTASRERITSGLRRAEKREAFDGTLEGALGRIDFATDSASLPKGTALVIEAVTEQVEHKVEVLIAAENAVSDKSVLATNTSSLSIAELGVSLRRQHQFIGMHFFNPVPVSDLIEVVMGPKTSEEVCDRVVGWVHSLGKSEVVVNDSPGFATTRLGVLLGMEAIRMLEEGVADAESIDRAMQLGYRHALGPLRSTDLVGLDVRLAIAESLYRNLGDRFAPPMLLREKVARGELGRKSGRGFYDYVVQAGDADATRHSGREDD